MSKKNLLLGIGVICVVLGMTSAVLLSGLGTPDLSKVPGTVVGHEPAPSLFKRLLGKAQYVGSPSIAILPDGTYVASHDLFGLGSSQKTSGITKVFRSTDKGVTWDLAATLNGQFWSTLFVHNKALYIYGYTAAGGDIVIRESKDGGTIWSRPLDAQSGLIKKGRFGGTPSKPALCEGRLWLARGTQLLSAPAGANLLEASSWTLSKSVPQDKSWLGGRFAFWSEGQVAASPEEGVTLLPKVNQLPYTALLRANSPRSLQFAAPNDFVELPGAEKKFGASYDEVSGKYYVCSNPVLPVHQNDKWLGNKPALIRNAAALLSSPDLRHWDMEKIFLYSPNLYHEAFQYLNFEFDGDDLAVISRTAFVVGGPQPPRGHDSNLMTFHRIPNFRHCSPEQEIEIDAETHQVMRYERTQYLRAPLGPFALGTQFDGAPLQHPLELAQDEQGRVYIREENGRILQFDAAGDYLGMVTASPAPFTGQRISIAQPENSQRTWCGFGSNDWDDPSNWFYWGRPDTPKEIAIFGSAARSSTEITIGRSYHLKGLRFRNSSSYHIAGDNQLAIGSPDSEGLIEVIKGNHAIQTPIRFRGNVQINMDAGTNLTIESVFDAEGNTIRFSGEGTVRFHNSFALGNGRLILSPRQTLVFDASAAPLLNGVIEVRFQEGFNPALGQNFQIFDFKTPPHHPANQLDLPDLPNGLTWDSSRLCVSGVLGIMPSR